MILIKQLVDNVLQLVTAVFLKLTEHVVSPVSSTDFIRVVKERVWSDVCSLREFLVKPF